MQPLQGLKVVELARILAGPWAGQTLADLGAEVIKVESPAGDDTRQWGPPFIEREGDFELGAHAVGAGHQHGLFVAFGHLEQRAEATDTGQNALAHRLFGQRLDALDQRVACIDIDAGIFVCAQFCTRSGLFTVSVISRRIFPSDISVGTEIGYLPVKQAVHSFSSAIVVAAIKPSSET